MFLGWCIAVAPASTPTNAVTNAWAFQTSDIIYSSPALGPDGRIYVGSDDHRLYKLTPDGAKVWEFAVPERIFSSPAIAPDGHVYFGARNGILYAVDENGRQQWDFATGAEIVSSPAIGSDGVILFGSSDGKVYALNPSGSLRWSFPTGGPVWSSPAIRPEGTVYIGSNDWKLYALRPDGTRKWEFTAAGPILSSPAIGLEETIYVGTLNGWIQAVKSDGTKAWELWVGYEIDSSAAVASDGTIYLGANDANLYALNPNGTIKWQFKAGSWIQSSPLIGADGTLYFGGMDNQFYALTAGGAKKWSLNLARPVYSSPVMGPEGTIYFGALDGKLYAVRTTNTLATAPWPMFRRNYQHTAAGFVWRSLPATYSPGLKFVVRLAAQPPAATSVYVVQDRPPADWAVGTISDAGLFDTSNKLVKFGPFLDACPRLLSYEVTPPQGQTGTQRFQGAGNADSLETTIDGRAAQEFLPLHPADFDPIDARMTLEETTAYGAAWKRGGIWPLGPNPVPVNYLTKAIALWQKGEFYQYDTNQAAAPFYWINATSAPPSGLGTNLPAPVSGSGTGSATVDLPPLYQAGLPLAVTLQVMPDPNTVVYALEDQPPSLWSVTNISTDGWFDNITRKVKWGPYFDSQVRRFRYEAIPPPNAAGRYAFAGAASFDGTNLSLVGQRTTTDHLSPPIFTLPVLTNGAVQLTLLVDEGLLYALQAGTNVQTWMDVTNFISTSTNFVYLDDQVTNLPTRFFRALHETN